MKAIEIHQVHNIFNNITHDEDVPFQNRHVTEFEPNENGEQNMGKQNKLLSTNFQVKIEN